MNNLNDMFQTIVDLMSHGPPEAEALPDGGGATPEAKEEETTPKAGGDATPAPAAAGNTTPAPAAAGNTTPAPAVAANTTPAPDAGNSYTITS